MQGKIGVSSLKILFILNNYSYFAHSKVTGPKSIIALIGLLKKQGASIDLCVPDCNISNFPHKVNLHKMSFLKLIKLTIDCEVIVVDRHFFFLGWILSKVFRKKMCLRLLGIGIRLSSKRLLSKRNFIKVLTRISPVDLLISTFDGSSSEQWIRFIKALKVSHRINGIETEQKTYIRNNLNNSSFFFVGRDSPEKGLLRVLETFVEIETPNKRLDIFGPSQVPNQYRDLVENGTIHVHGFSDRATIARLTAKHSIMISGNKLAALGNAEIEALAAGKYIIYLGPKNFLSYVPKRLLGKYGRSYSEVIKKLTSNKSQPLHFDDFNKVHQKDCDDIMQLLSPLN